MEANVGKEGDEMSTVPESRKLNKECKDRVRVRIYTL
jgi:hypothetical protein